MRQTNVNIAGTLTAGDENGFSSTFYVGKIHKNVIPNSIEGNFEEFLIRKTEVTTPVGIGYTWLMGSSARIISQSAEWRKSHVGEKYCFSLWVKADKPTTFFIYQDEYFIQSIDIDSTDWRRILVTFVVQDSKELNLVMRIDSSIVGVLITAPQLEPGTTPSQYQPTDGTLSYVEDYGAWFSKGGIGGTIQNPLLKLNEDGSISSRDNSFVINPDGTGHFASGRFKWTKDTISLQDVTIKWEDLNEEAQENLKPIVVEIVSNQGLIIKNGNNNVDITAKVYRDGKELDIEGTTYTYTWSLWNSSGTVVVRTYTGKSIIVDKNDVANMGILSCEVSE